MTLLQVLARCRGVGLGQLARRARLRRSRRRDPLDVRGLAGLLTGVGEREDVLLVRVDERAGELLAGVDRLVVVLADPLGDLLEVVRRLGLGGHGEPFRLGVAVLAVYHIIWLAASTLRELFAQLALADLAGRRARERLDELD